MGKVDLYVYYLDKIVFLKRKYNKKVRKGLVELQIDTLEDKDTFCLGEFRNICSVEPQDYRTCDFFANLRSKGVPTEIYQGMYGDSLFFKEVYQKYTCIVAYNNAGDILLRENNKVFIDGKYKENLYFTRLDKEIYWQELTKEVKRGILKSLEDAKGEDIINSEEVKAIIQKLKVKEIKSTKNGLIYMDGTFETIAFWGNVNAVKILWLSDKIEHI